MRPEFAASLISHARRMLRSLWLALGASIVAILFIGQRVIDGPTEARPGIVGPLTAAAVAIATASFVFYRRTRLESLREAAVDEAPRAALPGLSAEGPAERRFMNATQQLFTRSIVAWALADASAVVGLNVAVVSGDRGQALAIGVAALVLLLGLERPRIKALEALASELSAL
jgi:hypothetical protein